MSQIKKNPLFDKGILYIFNYTIPYPSTSISILISQPFISMIMQIKLNNNILVLLFNLTYYCEDFMKNRHLDKHMFYSSAFFNS